MNMIASIRTSLSKFSLNELGQGLVRTAKVAVQAQGVAGAQHFWQFWFYFSKMARLRP